MGTKQPAVSALIAALRVQYKSAQAKSAFLQLKQAEFRPGCDIAFHGLRRAREEFAQAHSILTGEARMVEDAVAREKGTIAASDQRLLIEIAAFCRQEISRC